MTFHKEEPEMKKGFMVFLLCSVVAALLMAKGESEQAGKEKTVTIEFIQWWEPELPQGAFRALMDEFEAKNPNIKVKLVSGPYSNTRDQIVTGAATETLSDVVGLDGAWVNDLAKQGAIIPLDSFMNQGGFNPKEIAAIIKLDGKSYMFPVATFVYPIFVNLNMFDDAGIKKMPSSRSDFVAAARKLTNASKNQYGWVLPLSLQSPNGIQNDVLSWLWASGKTMLKNGKPNLVTQDVIGTIDFIQTLYSEGLISPGSFTKQEQDKVEEFANGRIGMMVDTLAHINMIRERNPKLRFAITAIPAEDGYTGTRGLPYAAWGIGISKNSKHKEEAWKLVSFLMSAEINTKLVSIANAFPGNVKATPDFVKSDELFKQGFDIFQKGYIANEFVGLPVAEELMRQFDTELQLVLDKKQTSRQAVEKIQAKWAKEF